MQNAKCRMQNYGIKIILHFAFSILHYKEILCAQF